MSKEDSLLNDNKQQEYNSFTGDEENPQASSQVVAEPRYLTGKLKGLHIVFSALYGLTLAMTLDFQAISIYQYFNWTESNFTDTSPGSQGLIGVTCFMSLVFAVAAMRTIGKISKKALKYDEEDEALSKCRVGFRFTTSITSALFRSSVFGASLGILIGSISDQNLAAEIVPTVIAFCCGLICQFSLFNYNNAKNKGKKSKSLAKNQSMQAITKPDDSSSVSQSTKPLNNKVAKEFVSWSCGFIYSLGNAALTINIARLTIGQLAGVDIALSPLLNDALGNGIMAAVVILVAIPTSFVLTRSFHNLIAKNFKWVFSKTDQNSKKSFKAFLNVTKTYVSVLKGLIVGMGVFNFINYLGPEAHTGTMAASIAVGIFSALIDMTGRAAIYFGSENDKQTAISRVPSAVSIAPTQNGNN